MAKKYETGINWPGKMIGLQSVHFGCKNEDWSAEVQGKEEKGLPDWVAKGRVGLQNQRGAWRIGAAPGASSGGGCFATQSFAQKAVDNPR